MKLKFKKQTYQSNAVEAVADCFAGQPKFTGIEYRIDPGRTEDACGQVMAALETGGFQNPDIALTPGQVLEKLPDLRKQHCVEHLAQMAHAASAALEADDAFNPRDMAKAPQAKSVFQIGELFTQLRSLHKAVNQLAA